MPIQILYVKKFFRIFINVFFRNRVQERLGDRISGLLSDRTSQNNSGGGSGPSDRLSLNERTVTERLERNAMNSSGSGSGSEGNPTKFLIPGTGPHFSNSSPVLSDVLFYGSR